MAVTVSSQLTTLSSAESTTGWTAFNISGAVGALSALQASDEEMPPREGTYCLGWDQDIENGGYYYGVSSTNYSNYHVYIWAASFTAAACEVLSPGSGQSGVYIYARDSSGNAGYWHVGGSDTYKGGWKCFVAYLGRTPDTNSGTAPNMAQCTGVGIGFNHNAKSKLPHNMFIDFLRVGATGSGIQVSTTSGSVATWDDIASGDDTAAIGICRKESGVYFLQGPVSFGDGTSLSCEFADAGRTIVFEDADVNQSHYQLNFNAYNGGTHEYVFGSKVGGQGVRGGSVIGLLPWQLNCYATYIDVYQFYGVNINNATVSTGYRDGTTPTNREFVSCNFVECSPVNAETTTIQYCNIIGAATRGAYQNEYLTDCNFINCPVGLYYGVADSYDLDGNKFYGCTVDIENGDLSTFMASNPTSGYTALVSLNNDNYRYAQTFTGDGGDITYLMFYLAGIVGTGTGYVEAYLYGTSGGAPTGSPLATFSQVTHSFVKLIGGEWLTTIGFGIDTAYTTTNSTVYAAAIRSVGHDGSNYLSLALSAAGAHSGVYYTYNGSTWSPSGVNDLIFYAGKNDLLTINKINGANPSIGFPDGDAITKIQASLTLSMTVKDESGTEVSGAYAYIDDDDTSPYIMNTTTNASGVAQTSYTGASVTGSRWRVRKYGYKPYRQLVDIGSSDISIPVTLIADPQQT
jgi:hypothetical protein